MTHVSAQSFALTYLEESISEIVPLPKFGKGFKRPASNVPSVLRPLGFALFNILALPFSAWISRRMRCHLLNPAQRISIGGSSGSGGGGGGGGNPVSLTTHFLG